MTQSCEWSRERPSVTVNSTHTTAQQAHAAQQARAATESKSKGASERVREREGAQEEARERKGRGKGKGEGGERNAFIDTQSTSTTAFSNDVTLMCRRSSAHSIHIYLTIAPAVIIHTYLTLSPAVIIHISHHLARIHNAHISLSRPQS